MEDTTNTDANDDLTADEQLTLTMLPNLIGSAVAFSAKSGPIGTVKEMMANAKTAAAGQKAFPDNSLIASILPNMDDAGEAMAKVKAMREEQIERLKAAGVKSREDMVSHAIEQARVAKELLDSKASSDEAAEFKAWLVSIGDAVARAAKEGGFLGFGGEEVSEGEQETMASVRDALGL